jgi:CubicO group peptidase (beta-lactamase class C family)
MRNASVKAVAVLTLLLGEVATAADARLVQVREALSSTVRSAHEAGRFDGVMLVARGEQVLYEGAVGLADREQARRHTVDAPFRWASVTKQLTALLVMQEVEAGRLSLTGTLRQYLPTFSGPSGDRITLQQLLQHTSGLPNPSDMPEGAEGMPAFYKNTGPTAGDSLAAATGLCSGPAKKEPGTAFEYNNCDYFVLGAILERVTGKPYAQLVRDRLSRPLGLRSLRLFSPGAAKALSGMVGYEGPKQREPQFNMATYGPVGSLYGSVRDLWKIDRALMSHQLLSRENSETMWKGEPSLGYVALGAWSYPATLKGCAAPVAVVERQGHIGGIRVLNLFVPSEQVALIAVSNQEKTDFGALWSGKGLSYDILRATLCP